MENSNSPAKSRSLVTVRDDAGAGVTLDHPDSLLAHSFWLRGCVLRHGVVFHNLAEHGAAVVARAPGSGVSALVEQDASVVSPHPGNGLPDEVDHRSVARELYRHFQCDFDIAAAVLNARGEVP